MPTRIGTFEQVLEEYARAKGIPAWRMHTKVQDGEYVHMALRRTLGTLGIPMHAEVLAGLSYRAFRGVDVYRNFWSEGMPLSDVHASHWVVCQQSQEHGQRYALRPENWFHGNVWLPYDQKDDVLEWQCSIHPAVREIAEKYAMVVPCDVFGIEDLRVREQVRSILRGVYPNVPEYVIPDEMGERIRAARMEVVQVHIDQQKKGKGKGKGKGKNAIAYPSDAETFALMRTRSSL